MARSSTASFVYLPCLLIVVGSCTSPPGEGCVTSPPCAFPGAMTSGGLCRTPDPMPVPDPLAASFLPSDLPGLKAWFRADVGLFEDAVAPQPALADGDPIARWNDSSNANSAVQGEPSRAPVLRVNAVNGVSAVCFDATQFLALSQSISLQDHTIFAVTKPDFSRQISDVLLGSDRSYLLALFMVDGTGYAGLSYYTGTMQLNSQMGTPPAVWQLAESDRKGSTWNPRLNGEALSVGGVTTSEPQLFSSFGNYGGTYYYSGCVAEVIVYDRFLGDDERDRVRTYLAARFGIAGIAPPRVMFSGGPTGNYNMTPATVSLPDGTLVTVFRNGPGHIGVGEVLAMSSHDGGATWTAPVLVAKDPKLDVRSNVGLIRLADGTLLLPVEKEAERPSSMELSITVIGTWLTRSYDGGTTWTALEPVTTPPGYDFLYPYGTLIERPDGTLLMPAYGWRTGSHYWDALLLASLDHGTSWTLRGVIAAGNDQQEFSETAIAYRGATLVAVIRENKSYRLWLATSSHDGWTWDDPQDFDLGTSPALLPLSDGRLLLTYAQRRGVPGIYARIVKTTANGTFDVAAMQARAPYPISATGLYAVGLGYPAPVELPGGKIFVNYWSEAMGRDACRSRIWSRTFDLSSLGP